MNLEDVTHTIKEIEKERQKPSKTSLLRKILMWVFFPVTIPVILVRKFFFRRRVRLTTKTTIIFSAIFGIIIIGYVVFVLAMLGDYFRKQGDEHNSFFIGMIISSIIMVIVFLFVGSAAGALISNTMLKPIRGMITQIDNINGEDLSKRLQPVDSQDEIMELVDQINNMLGSLEMAFEQQSNFVADASHELKTPLSVITGYGNLLDRWGKDDPEILKEAIEAIKRESKYMAKIVEQMLLLARLGGFNMTSQKFELVEAVKEIIDGYQIITHDHTISFTAGKPAAAETDKALLTEAVRAIIDNAIKYTPKGGRITVFAGFIEEENKTIISIKDTGVGIDEQSLKKIFDRFYRCDKTRGREKGSAGLGLTICKSIIDMMGGRIDVESVKGKGSEFKIVF
jgi:signal transduction histidine kinase